MSSRHTSPVVEAPPLRALKPPITRQQPLLSSSLSIAFDALEDLKDKLSYCQMMAFQIEVVLTDIKTSADCASASENTSLIDLSRDPRPAAKVLLAAQEAQRAQEAQEALKVEAAMKAPEAQQAATSASVESSSSSHVVNEIDTSCPSAPAFSSPPAPSGNKAGPAAVVSRLSGPVDLIEGMRKGADVDRLLMMQRASLPKGNVHGLAYTCEAKCGYDDTAADFVNCDSAFHRKQPQLKLPTGEYSDRGWYHRPCEEIPPGPVPSTWICSSCRAKGRTSTDDHDYDDGDDSDQDDKPDADDFDGSEDGFDPGQGTPSENSDDTDGQDEDQDDHEDLGSKNADKNNCHISDEDAQDNDQDVQNDDHDLQDGDQDSDDDEQDSQGESDHDYDYVNPDNRWKPYIIGDDSDSQDESDYDYDYVNPDNCWEPFIIDDKDKQDSNQAAKTPSSKITRKKPSKSQNSTPHSLGTASANQTPLPPLKTFSRQRWLEEEKAEAIRLMKEIIDQDVISGEARFEETARRLQLQGYHREWTGVKNVWNRGLRERSGYDERRNQQAPKTTSKQDAETKRKRKEKKEQASRASTIETDGYGGGGSKTVNQTNDQPQSSTAAQTNGYGSSRSGTARQIKEQTQNPNTTRANGNATPRTKSQSPKRQHVADEDDEATPTKRQRSVS